MEFLQDPFPWYIAGPLIAINLFLLFYMGERFGLSRSFRTACSIAGAGKKFPFFNYEWKKEIWLMIYLLGSAIGGFIAFQFLNAGAPVIVSAKTTIALQQLNITPNQSFEPQEIFSYVHLFTPKNFILLLSGGILIGFGTRWAGGCTSGHAISGLSDLQLSSLIAVIGFFTGGLIMTHLFIPLIFK